MGKDILNIEILRNWLVELSDSEVIELLEIVSNDLKRRNNLNGTPSGENIHESINKFLYGDHGKD